MWHDLLAALALVLVIEGLIPFWKPQALRQMVEMLAQLDDRSIRVAGLVSMVAGLLLLYLVRN
ncbi:MAG: DUF2065 domain-containing protein [Gammaproteobacteria bacterium]|jgi:uncharacterized protein|nr:DUF2065 domain-containing protein [Gammaproteobacteria bacterium]MCW9057707.1 DUF2065 domain-containing protein [Gammaproteobacteria bacterium]